eukprot:TRINITY_DN5192_c0_g6_i2.p1 TRINITY_DN5192_c0_g6~~TRINITY_DN5192_c0_g6_i2.p1  ORF type:complete len:187 (+),score=54.68 TRINITY_DN5192_c0_g6_i2:182-742(+)
MKVFVANFAFHQGVNGKVAPINSVAIHPDLTRFATAGGDNKVKIWCMVTLLKAMEDQEINKAMEPLCTLSSHNGQVACVRWSNSGEYLASCSDDMTIIIWKFGGRSSIAPIKEFWKCLTTIKKHTADVIDVCWSPDDKYIASTSVSNCIIIWDLEHNQMVTTLQAHRTIVKGVAWDPIGKYIATQV